MHYKSGPIAIPTSDHCIDRVEKTETKYTIVIWGLTAEDDYTKFSCKLWDSELKDRWKTLKSYRLELKPVCLSFRVVFGL